jgi:hypothetical protein
MKARIAQRATLGVAAIIGAAALLAPSGAVAADTVLNDNPLNLMTWSLDATAYTYGQFFSRTPDSEINPGNDFAHLPSTTLIGQLRPNLRATSTYFDLVAQPRLVSSWQAGGVNEQESVRGYFQQGYIRAKPTDEISITAGRELITWGPAFFRSPSNPFYFNNARLDPIVELSGIDLARASYTPTENIGLTVGVAFDSGQDLAPKNPDRDAPFAKMDYHKDNYLGSLVVAALRSEQVFFGGFAQETVNDAILLYQEFGSSSGSKQNQTLTYGGVTYFNPETTGRRTATALIGGSYTFTNGHSIYAEYLYNGNGYDGSHLHRYFQQAGAAGIQQVLGGSASGLGTETIGYAANEAQNLLGQHYLYLQYQNNQAQSNTLWRLMASENLEDYSAQLSIYVEQNITSRVSFFLLGTTNVGPRGSEFGGLFRESLLIGFKFFLF